MKKKYNAPEMWIVELQHVMPLATSGVGANDPYNIGYGGVDTGGTLIPSARENNGFWDERW